MKPSFQNCSTEGIWYLTGFHDGWLTGVTVEEKQTTIWCSTNSNQKYRVVIPKMIFLCLNSFTGANIINAIVFYRSDTCPVKLFAAANEITAPQWAPVLANRFDEFKQSKNALIEFATSDGANLLVGTSASFENIEIVTCT
jgi:hypothetical protein